LIAEAALDALIAKRPPTSSKTSAIRSATPLRRPGFIDGASSSASSSPSIAAGAARSRALPRLGQTSRSAGCGLRAVSRCACSAGSGSTWRRQFWHQTMSRTWAVAALSSAGRARLSFVLRERKPPV